MPLSPPQVLAILALLAFAAILAFMTVGARGSWDFILPFRGTKIWAMVVVGYAIALSTVLFQTITANRILTPSIMGFDALYALIQTIIVFMFGGFAFATLDPQLRFVIEVAAMVFFSTLLFRWLFSGAPRSLHLLVLVGIVFGVFFRSLSGLMQRLINPNDFAILQDALFASFNTVDPTLLLVATLAVAGVSIAALRMLPTLDVLTLGREQAINLGVDHKRTVTAILMMVSILVSVSTALVGPVTFFGLLVANLAYLLIRSHKHALIVPAAALISVICLVGGQVVLERVFGYNSALSIIIEFVGGLVFLVILLRGNVR
ncbi:iron chelate uptake ABC transporter family permease subunit [Devosia pacifica]|uniref:iron chelate uptake ABC transporter family permease subunit n=1 Tax=Devosia pacifica TaxID=1335967 RepID=UPI00357171F8